MSVNTHITYDDMVEAILMASELSGLQGEAYEIDVHPEQLKKMPSELVVGLMNDHAPLLTSVGLGDDVPINAIDVTFVVPEAASSPVKGTTRSSYRHYFDKTGPVPRYTGCTRQYQFKYPQLTEPVEQWVLHSPYPDGTWRGIEKCSCNADGSLRLFQAEHEAEQFKEKERLGGGPESYFTPVKLELRTPRVRSIIKPIEVTPSKGV